MRSMLAAALLLTSACSGKPAEMACQGPVDIQTAADLDAHRDCTSIDGDLRIEGTQLATLAGLEKLKSISGVLVISGAPSLSTLSALRHLRVVQGITIDRAPALRSLQGLGDIKSLDGLVVTNTGVEDFSGMESLTRIGDLVIVANERLERLTGLEGIAHIGNFDLERNPSLHGSIDELARVSNAVYVQDNPSLTTYRVVSVLSAAN